MLVLFTNLVQIAVRNIVEWVKEHPNARGAYIADKGVTDWMRWMTKLITTKKEWIAADKLGNFENPTFGISGTNVSFPCYQVVYIAIYAVSLTIVLIVSGE